MIRLEIPLKASCKKEFGGKKDWYGIIWLHLCIYSDGNVCVKQVE